MQAFIRDTQYRAHFIATVVVGTIQLGLAMLPILLMFSYTNSVRGWSRADVLMLVGIYQIVTGILATFIAPNLGRMTKYISQGELDTVLLRPVSAQFNLTFRWVQLAELGNVATGAAVLAVGLSLSDREPSPVGIIQAVLLVVCGLFLLTCVWSALTYLAFWTQACDPISDVFLAILDGGKYPLPFFPAGVRAFLTFAIPVGFATTMPAQALKGSLGWQPIFSGLALSVIAVTLTRIVWQRGVRTYASASS